MLPSCFDLSRPPSNFEEHPQRGWGQQSSTHVCNTCGKPWKCPKSSFKVLQRLNIKNQTIFELYTDDNKSKNSSNPKDILKSAKKIMKLYTKWTSTAATTEAVFKIPNIKKISNEHFNICEAEISIDTFQMN